MMISKQQNGRAKDQIKKLEKEKSMKDGLEKAPIQKKPSSSRVDASKGKLQVSSNSLTSSGNIKNMNNSENPISSKPVSASDHSGSKAVAEDLVKNSSLKPVRYSMKRNSGVGLHPTVNLSRDTSSSTVKIARDPRNLDLDEAHGASNLKLCSYKYCSVHGQKKHEVPLPALKCFLSARRKPVKVPNSMKQKEKPSTRKNESCDKRSQNEVETVNTVNGINWVIMDDHDETNQLQESYTVTSFEDYVDNNSEISVEEMVGFDERLHYIEDERQEEAPLETEDGKIGYVDWDETTGPYLQSQSDSLQCFDDFLGRTQDNIIGVEGCKFTPKQENTLGTSNEAGVDLKLFLEADSKLFLEADDVKVDHKIQQSTTFSSDSEENSEETANGSLQSVAELPTSPKEFLEEIFEKFEVHRKEKHDIKVNVENVGCCEPSKQETNYESQKGIRSNYDKYGDIFDGFERKKENLTNSASFISENPLAELTNRPKAKYSTTKKITAVNQDNAREFNPRPPRFLPLKPEQETEVVNLKHHTVEERKKAEEWMIDYALQNTLRRLAPAKKRKVALLVAAFESVIQQEQCTTVP